MAICGLGCRQATGSMRTAGTLAGARSAGTANVGVASDHRHTLPGGRAGKPRAVPPGQRITGQYGLDQLLGCKTGLQAPRDMPSQLRSSAKTAIPPPSRPTSWSTAGGDDGWQLRCDGSAQRRQARPMLGEPRWRPLRYFNTPPEGSSKPRRAWSLTRVRQVQQRHSDSYHHPPATGPTLSVATAEPHALVSLKKLMIERPLRRRLLRNGMACAAAAIPSRSAPVRRSGSAQKFLSRP